MYMCVYIFIVGTYVCKSSGQVGEQSQINWATNTQLIDFILGIRFGYGSHHGTQRVFPCWYPVATLSFHR